MIWDAVRARTYEPVRTFGVWALSPFQGSFGHELFSDDQLDRIARHIATGTSGHEVSVRQMHGRS